MGPPMAIDAITTRPSVNRAMCSGRILDRVSTLGSRVSDLLHLIWRCPHSSVSDVGHSRAHSLCDREEKCGFARMPGRQERERSAATSRHGRR